MSTRLFTITILSAFILNPFCYADALSSQEHKEITDLWVNLDRHTSADNSVVTNLMGRHEISIEVLLDLLYGAEKKTDMKSDSVDELVKKLGSSTYKERIAAHKDLEKKGHDILIKIEKHKNHDDPEISMRIREIIDSISSKPKKHVKPFDIQRNAANILVMYWPMTELRNVMNNNFERLAKAKLPYPSTTSWKSSVIVPLLASLRYSENEADRENVSKFLDMSDGSKKLIALKLMRQYGLSGFDINYTSHRWPKAPTHDYEGVIYKHMVPQDRTVFLQAMRSVKKGPTLRKKLLTTIESTTDQELKDDIVKYLWTSMNDPTALKIIAEGLQSTSYSFFSKTVSAIIRSSSMQPLHTAIPVLKPVLEGEDDRRKIQIIRTLGNNSWGAENTILSSKTIAPFLGHSNGELDDAAKYALLRLQGKDGENVLKDIGETHENDSVRSEAKALYNEWRANIQRHSQESYRRPWPDIVDKKERAKRDSIRAELALEIKTLVEKLDSVNDAEKGEIKKNLIAYEFSSIPIIKEQKPAVSTETAKEIDNIISEIRSRYWNKHHPNKDREILLTEAKAYLDNAGFRNHAIDINSEGLCRMILNSKDTGDISFLQDIPFYNLSLNSVKAYDLKAIKGQPLKQLSLSHLAITDLSPLKGMQLNTLKLTGSHMADLTPLKGMPLRDLDISGCYNVTNLAGLEDMPLDQLNMNYTSVSDLSPLSNSTMAKLYTHGSPIKDLTPIKNVPLTYLTFDPQAVTSGISEVMQMEKLRYINHYNASSYWNRNKSKGHPYFITNVERPCFWNKEMKYCLRLRNSTPTPVIISGKWNTLSDNKSFIKPAILSERTIQPGKEEDVIFNCAFMDGLKEKPRFTWKVKDQDNVYTGEKMIHVIRSGYYVEGATTPVPKEAVFHLGENSWMTKNKKNSWNGPDDCSATAVLRKEKDGLRVQMKVVDDKLIVEDPRLIMNDAIAMYFDFRPDKRRNHNMMGAGPFNVVVVPPVKTDVPVTHRVNAIYGKIQVDNVVVKSQLVENGYIVEVFLPYSGFSIFHGMPGETFTFDIAVCDKDAQGPQHNNKIRWSGRQYNAMNVQNWGFVEKAPKLKDTSKNAFTFTIK